MCNNIINAKFSLLCSIDRQFKIFLSDKIPVEKVILIVKGNLFTAAAANAEQLQITISTENKIYIERTRSELYFIFW